MYLFSLIFAIGLIVVYGVPILIAYFVQKWLRNKGYTEVGLAIIISVVAYQVSSTYYGFYPTDSFYIAELERVTNMQAPNSAVVKHADASYPDLHGDYNAYAIISLSKSDYQLLLKCVRDDAQMITDNEASQQQNTHFKRTGTDYLSITFFKDGETIEIYTSSS